MGKKYIIELESGTHIFVLGPEGIVHIGEPDVVYETVDGMQIGDAVINAKPYTEPDLEQVKRDYDAWYEKGLDDAWEAAKKLWDLKGEMIKVFRKYSVFDILNCYTAAEAIEKLKAYEQEKEEIEVGDEVVSENDIKAVVIDMDDYLLHVLNENGVVDGWPREDVAKTDRHFTEIAAVLEKMRGEQDG